MLREIIIFSLLISFISGCSIFKQNRISPVGDWIRSDDSGEYHGLYVYSLTPDGTIYFTNFPEKWPKQKGKRIKFGKWEESNGILKWLKNDGSLFTSYKLGNHGKYWEVDGHYYVPVYIERIELIDGKPKNKK